MAASDLDPPPRATTSEGLVRQLVDLLDVETIDTDLYRGARQPGGHGRVFGGQVIAQALQAAQRTVEGKAAHSLHAYFLRGGDEQRPIVFRVVRDFDGRSFVNRRVIATQGGEPILNLAASFHLEESGFEHQDSMPDVPGPDDLLRETDVREQIAERIPEKARDWFLRERPIEMRHITPLHWIDPDYAEPVQRVWFRASAPLGDAPQDVHRAVLAYASDMLLLGTSLIPHGVNFFNRRAVTASLDHALWFHGPVRADEWMLYATDSTWAGGARGFNLGQIFTRDGRLVASVAQEGLIRPMTR